MENLYLLYRAEIHSVTNPDIGGLSLWYPSSETAETAAKLHTDASNSVYAGGMFTILASLHTLSIEQLEFLKENGCLKATEEFSPTLA